MRTLPICGAASLAVSDGVLVLKRFELADNLSSDADLPERRTILSRDSFNHVTCW